MIIFLIYLNFMEKKICIYLILSELLKVFILIMT